MENNIINLIYFDARRKHGYHNFGDSLAPFVLSKLLPKKFQLKFNLEHKATDPGVMPIDIVSLGSYIHSARPHSLIYGTGLRSYPPLEISRTKFASLASSLKVYMARGYLTKRILRSTGSEIVHDVCGDPALLLNNFYVPSVIEKCANKILIIPNLNTYHLFKDIELPRGCILISPFESWELVASSIYSSRAVIAGSLHGLILADMYNIPNAWLALPKLNEGSFKFMDYFSSQDRKPVFISDISECHSFSEYYDKGSRLSTQEMLNAFPFPFVVNE